MAHPLFTPELRDMLSTNDSREMRAFCESLHPATIAETLADDFSPEEAWKIIAQTNIRAQAAIFEYFPISRQVEMVEAGGRADMAKLIEKMSHDDRVDLLRRLSPRVAEGLLRLVDEADRRDIAALSGFPEDSVGSIMTTDYAWLPITLTVGEALDRLRQQAPDKETIYYVYILDENSRRLQGVVTLRDLVLADRGKPIRDLMNSDLVTLRVTDERKRAAELLGRFDLLAVPVVDNESRLVGIVTYDDGMDVVVQEATKDIQQQGAVGTFDENYLEVPFLKIWRKRTFWLSCLFIAEMATFSAMAVFEEPIEAIKILAFFIPLCLATGGNSGTQAATLITRALALGQITNRQWFRVLRHEILIGLAMGIVLGCFGFMRSLIVPEDMLTTGDQKITHAQLGIVIGLAVWMICLAGTVIGAMLPLVFHRFGVDPGLASSPFVATFVDVTGIVIYFGLASLVLL